LEGSTCLGSLSEADRRIDLAALHTGDDVIGHGGISSSS
jgi:hypothetical protein